MIDFRYHIVSIVAIFFALAAGVLLGSGPLKDTAGDLIASQAERDRKLLDEEREKNSELLALARYRDEYASKVASTLTLTQLKDRRIALVSMPGADDSLVEGIGKALDNAGGQITTRVSLDEKLFDPEQQPMIDPLTNQLVTADITFGKDSTTYQRAGQILARGVAAKEEGDPVDDSATKVLSGLTGSKLLGVKPTPKDRASLVVVVAAEPPDPRPEDSSYRNAVDLVQGLDLGSAGVVLAGAPASARDGGLVKALRGESEATKAVSTVDVANLPTGQAALVFALVEQAAGKSGQYGAVEAKDGVAPKTVMVPEG